MRASGALLLFACCAATGYTGTVPGCEPLPGSEALWSRPGLRFMLVGEMHGTAETPAIFRDLVCAATSLQRPIVVGIERPAGEQPAMDAFLAPTNHEAAVGALLAQRGWGVVEGRSSRAMLGLLEALRGLKLEGRIAEVVAFDDRRDGESDAQREQRMAAVLLAAADRHAKGLVIALAGNLHPMKTFRSCARMGMLLPAAQTVSLMAIDKGGEAWTGMDDGCRPHRMNPTGGVQRGVVLSEGAAPMGGYDGVLATGLNATASPPAIKDPPALPACSKD